VRTAILTFDGFNEIDSFVFVSMLNRIQRPGWRAEIVAPTELVTSMNGEGRRGRGASLRDAGR
jgi:hypothetical protein